MITKKMTMKTTTRQYNNCITYIQHLKKWYNVLFNLLVYLFFLLRFQWKLHGTGYSSCFFLLLLLIPLMYNLKISDIIISNHNVNEILGDFCIWFWKKPRTRKRVGVNRLIKRWEMRVAAQFDQPRPLINWFIFTTRYCLDRDSVQKYHIAIRVPTRVGIQNVKKSRKHEMNVTFHNWPTIFQVVGSPAGPSE